MKNKKTVAILMLFFLILCAVSFDAFAVEGKPTVSATGTLTSIEEDGSVIIDEKGYLVDPLATITDRMGRGNSLRGLSLPAAVNFEYIYSGKGFVIMVIQEVKENSQRRINR